MSRLTSFISDFDDEESLGFDSFSRGGLNTLTENLYSQGSISSSFDRDYYTINLGVGSYTIAMTSDASRYGYSTFNDSQFLQFDITDFSGNVLLSSQQDFSKGSLFDDVLEFTSNSFQTYYVEVYDQFSFSGADYALELISNGSSGGFTPTPTNTAPVAGNDTATATAGLPVLINLGSNDSDPDNDSLATSGFTNPSKGTVTYLQNSQGAFFSQHDHARYTPFSTATGTDSFRYQVSDGKGGTDTATVTVTITGANRDPVALNDTATARAGVATVISIGSNDSDPDNDSLTTSGVSGQGPSKGTVSYRDNFSTADTVTYTPFSTATGTDRFTYQVSDGKGGTDTATVSVTITALDIVGNISTTTSIEIGESFISEHTANDFQDLFRIALVAGQNYIFEVKGSSTGSGTMSDTFLSLYNNLGSFILGDNNSGIGNDAQIIYTATTTGIHYLGSTSGTLNNFSTGTYTISASTTALDIVGNISTTTSIEIGESFISEHTANDFQDLFRIALVAGQNYIFEVKGSSTGSGTMSDTFLSLYNNLGSFILGDNNSGIGNDAQIIYTATTTGIHYLGSTSGTLNNFSTGTYTISASTNNRDPVAGNDTGATRPGLPVTINIGLNDSDADNDQLTTTGLTNPSQGTVSYTDNSISADIVTYTPSRSATGTDRFTYQVSDGNGGTDTATVSVTISTVVIGGSTFFLNPNAPNNITGTSGNDFFLGSSRKDDIVNFSSLGTLSFNASDFTVREDGRNVIISNDIWGTDTLTGIEFFNFSDGQKQLSGLLNPENIDRGIYRFFNIDTGTHFLSGSTVERDSVINNLDSFNFEGPTFRAADPTDAAADTVFRFFNTQTGTHFFTQSTVERDNILDTIPQFNFEGEAYKGYTEQVDGSIPLYRFFNTQTGTHFYTAAEAEKDSIVANLPSFNFEGTAYWVDPVMG